MSNGAEYQTISNLISVAMNKDNRLFNSPKKAHAFNSLSSSSYINLQTWNKVEVGHKNSFFIHFTGLL